MKDQRRNHDGPEEIKKEIERTREKMGDTIEEIKEKLSAHYMKERVKEAAVEKTKKMMETTAAHAREWGGSLRQSVKNHPVWYAAGGAGAGGLVWLLARRSQHDGRLRPDSVQSADRSMEYVRDQNRCDEAAPPVEQKSEEEKNRLPEEIERNRLLLGAVTFLAGAIAGFMLPASTWESEWAGKARDLFDEAKERRL